MTVCIKIRALVTSENTGKTRKATLPEGRHGDNGVPEGRRDAHERGGAAALLGVKHDGGKHDDGHGQGEQQEAELWRAALQHIAEDAQSCRENLNIHLETPGKLAA